MPVRERFPWLIDEYIIVGDLWLRRGRAVGTNDAEVKSIAALVGRSPASISRRVGNFAGTDKPGTGLKPISGEPLKRWLDLRDDPSRLAKALREATVRLTMLVDGEAPGGTAVAPVRVVPPEQPGTEPVPVVTKEAAREATQAEAVLREEFRKWRDPRQNRLKGIEIEVASGKLRVDLYDPLANVLIEVKARATRDLLRLAVGQLYDYRRYLDFEVELAVLVPERPTDDLMGLLSSAGIGAIWPDGGAFSDSAAGHLLRTP